MFRSQWPTEANRVPRSKSAKIPFQAPVRCFFECPDVDGGSECSDNSECSNSTDHFGDFEGCVEVNSFDDVDGAAEERTNRSCPETGNEFGFEADANGVESSELDLSCPHPFVALDDSESRAGYHSAKVVFMEGPQAVTYVTV